MSDKKTKIVLKGNTPPGTFTFAWLEKPDTKFNKVQYKVTLLIPKGQEIKAKALQALGIKTTDDFAKKLNDLHKAAKGKTDGRPAKDGDAIAEDNEKRESWRGHWVLTFKSKNKPDQFSPDGKVKLRETSRSGDLGKVAFAAAEFDTGSNKGVTLYLNAIQLLERRAGAGVAFEDESDDYEAGDSAGFGEDDDDSGPGESTGGDSKSGDF